MDPLTSEWQKKFQVHLYHIDSRKKLTLPSFCNFFQDIAAEHAEQLDFGFDALNKKGVFWVLSRLQTRIFQYPQWGDDILVRTWPRGIEGMFALRDYEVYSSSGEKLASATSAWLILDKERHRPQRISEKDVLRSFSKDRFALTPLAEKIDFPEELMKSDSFKVRFSDIDLNQHVNNVKYMEWAVDSLPEEVLLNQNIDSFTVNFIGEAGLGNIISLWKTEANSEHHVSVRNDSTGKELCRIKMGTGDAI